MNHFNSVFNNAPVPGITTLAEHSFWPATPLSPLAVSQARATLYSHPWLLYTSILKAEILREYRETFLPVFEASVQQSSWLLQMKRLGL